MRQKLQDISAENGLKECPDEISEGKRDHGMKFTCFMSLLTSVSDVLSGSYYREFLFY